MLSLRRAIPSQGTRLLVGQEAVSVALASSSEDGWKSPTSSQTLTWDEGSPPPVETDLLVLGHAWWKARHDGNNTMEAWGPGLWLLWADNDKSLLGNSLKSVSWKICCVGSWALRRGGGERETRSFGPVLEGTVERRLSPCSQVPRGPSHWLVTLGPGPIYCFRPALPYALAGSSSGL